MNEARQPSAKSKPVKGEKDSFEKQAKDLLEGKETFKPTWQTLGIKYDRPSLAKFAVKQPEEIKGREEDNAKSKP